MYTFKHKILISNTPKQVYKLSKHRKPYIFFKKKRVEPLSKIKMSHTNLLHLIDNGVEFSLTL